MKTKDMTEVQVLFTFTENGLDALRGKVPQRRVKGELIAFPQALEAVKLLHEGKWDELLAFVERDDDLAWSLHDGLRLALVAEMYVLAETPLPTPDFWVGMGARRAIADLLAGGSPAVQQVKLE